MFNQTESANAAIRKGKVVQAAPEFESCKKLAAQKKVPLRQVYEAVSKITST
jgi:uncharacterized protein (DUF111 family)